MIGGWLAHLSAGLLDLLYPGVCFGCDAALPDGREAFCPPCAADLDRDGFPACPRCGLSVGPNLAPAKRCARCKQEPYAFEAVVRGGEYAGLRRDLIVRAKRPHTATLVERVGERWAECVGPRVAALGVEVVLPVPLHWRRHWHRGYNQSAVLAEALATHLRLPIHEQWLRRDRATPMQSAQTSAQRRENVRGAFSLRRRAAVAGRRVALVDDVLTTGSTASECARVLKVAGAAGVVVAVVARAG